MIPIGGRLVKGSSDWPYDTFLFARENAYGAAVSPVTTGTLFRVRSEGDMAAPCGNAA